LAEENKNMFRKSALSALMFDPGVYGLTLTVILAAGKARPGCR